MEIEIGSGAVLVGETSSGAEIRFAERWYCAACTRSLCSPEDLAAAFDRFQQVPGRGEPGRSLPRFSWFGELDGH